VFFDACLVLNEHSVCVGVARVGSDTQTIRCATLTGMSSADMGGPLHSLVVAGQLHPLERDMLKQFVDSSDEVKLEP
jgi:diphthine synthase